MKKILSVILMLTFMLCGVSAAKKTPISEITFSEPENLGKPISATTTLNSVVTMEDGIPVVCTTVSGSPACFNVINLETGELMHTFEAEKGNTMWTHAVDSLGNVYTAGYTRATLYRYSPSTKKFEDLGSLGTETAVCQIVVDDQDNVWMGTYPNAKLMKYDIATGKIMDFGNVLPGEKYFKSMVYYNGCIYGGGDAVGTQFVKINLKTLERKYIPGPKTSSGIKSYYTATLAGKRILIYCGTQSSGSIYTVFDLEKEAFLDIEIPKASGLSCSPELNGYSYFVANGVINKYNLSTDTYEPTSTKYGSSFRGGSFAELKTHPNLPGKTFVTVVYGGAISLIDLETGVRESYYDSVEPTGTSLVAVKAIGNHVYASGHMGPRATQYDPETKKVIATFSMGQSTPIAEIGGKVYFAAYPSASLSVFDPSLPVKENENPKTLVDLSKAKLGQSRPMDICDADGLIVYSTIADYDMLEGAFTVYDPATGKYDCYKNIIKNQSISGLEYKDGILYGSTTIFGGLGGDPSETEAKIFKFDMKERKLLMQKTPKLKETTGLMKMAGDLAFGPDGLLWCMSDGLLFAMNPETLEVVKEKVLVAYNWESFSSRWNPYTMQFTEDGLLYCTPRNTAMVVDIETLEAKKILPDSYNGNTGSISVSDKGDIYFYSRDSIMRVRRTDVEAAGERVSLMIDKTNAVVNGESKSLDVPPRIVEGGRTVVPVRFISEAFRAEVLWDDINRTVTVNNGATTLKIVIGEKKINKNGSTIETDVAAFIEDGRTLLPLRAVAEALDKKVFWDERGLIIISDSETNKEKDAALIEELIATINK